MIKKMLINLGKHVELVIIFILILFFLAILRDVHINEITFYDEMFMDIFVNTLRSDPLTYVMKFVTFLGSGYFLIFLSFLLLFLLKEKKYAYLSMINLTVVTILNILIKFIIKRPRPLDINIIIEDGFSFPSGHSMISFAFYGFLMYIVYKNMGKKKISYLLYFIISILILMIGISRIYLGVHYASDVLAGFIVSACYLIVYIVIIPKYIKRRKNSEKKEV